MNSLCSCVTSLSLTALFTLSRCIDAFEVPDPEMNRSWHTDLDLLPADELLLITSHGDLPMGDFGVVLPGDLTLRGDKRGGDCSDVIWHTTRRADENSVSWIAHNLDQYPDFRWEIFSWPTSQRAISFKLYHKGTTTSHD